MCTTDIKRIRKQFRVIGNLVGTFKGNSVYQNKLHGLPLQLLHEECVFLLGELHDVQLVMNDLKSIDVDGLVKQFEQFDNQQFNDYKQLHYHHAVEEVKEKLDRIIENKAAKENVSIDQIDREVVLNREIKKIRPVKELNRPKQLLVQSPWSAGLRAVEGEQANRLKLKRKLTKHSLLRHLVYSDLNRKGLYLTKGNKFGSDFLAYAGDPLFYHASYIVICLDQQQLSTTILQTYSRLSSQVNKHLLLAKFDDDSDLDKIDIDKIHYLDELTMLIKDKKFGLDYMAIKWRSVIESGINQ